MKKMKLFAVLFLTTLIANAQKVAVNGAIVDNDNEPIPGAIILIKGTENGSQTNFDGQFSIKVEKGDKLVISYVGFKTKEFKVKGDLNPKIKLFEDATVCFADVSYFLPFKINEFWAENLNSQADLYNCIRSNVPGVQITNTSIEQSSKITIRGDSNTIVIIDGVRYTDTSILNTINPADIKKIYVANSPIEEQYLLTKIN